METVNKEIIVHPETLLEAAKPLMKYLAENYYPYIKAIVEINRVELVEGIKMVKTDEFIKD